MVPYRRQLTGYLTVLGVSLSQVVGAAGDHDRLAPEESLQMSAALAGAETPAMGDELAINDETLGEMRGGFSIADGLQVDFGIQRAVYVNGNLVTTTSLNLPDLTKLTQGTNTSLSAANPASSSVTMPVSLPASGAATPGAVDTDAINSLALIQSGSGNTFQAGAMPSSSAGTVIQNTLDNQKLQNMTVIQATVNSLSILKSLDLQTTVRNAVNSSLLR